MSKIELLKQLEAKRTRCQIWTRVMGYLRNTDNFNIGKKGEYDLLISNILTEQAGDPEFFMNVYFRTNKDG